MENPEYQRIFNAFNACVTSPSKSSAARDFLTLSATPTTMLETLATVRSIATEKQLNDHKTSYLRGLMVSLDNNDWSKSADGLIDVTNWLISLRGRTLHATNYLYQLRILVAKVQRKITISPDQKQTWEKNLANKKKEYIPKYRVGVSPEFYGRNYRTPYTQCFSADDRN